MGKNDEEKKTILGKRPTCSIGIINQSMGKGIISAGRKGWEK